MKKTELKSFRLALEKRQAELAKESGRRDALTFEPGSDELDRIQFARDREQVFSTLERDFNRLREVRTALRRLDSGTFGTCIRCEERINSKRLAAVPWASCCIVCQEAADCAQQTPAYQTDAASGLEA